MEVCPHRLQINLKRRVGFAWKHWIETPHVHKFIGPDRLVTSINPSSLYED